MTANWDFVRGLEKFSLCDWPGRSVCVFFLSGCSMRCPTCHNQDLAWHPELLPRLSREQGLTFLKKQTGWLDGVVISGGEPTEQPELPMFIEEIGRIGLPVKLDTNGMNPSVVAEMLRSEQVSVVSVDLKGPFAKYPELTGGAVSREQAADCLENLFALAAEHPERFEFRATLVPALNSQDIEEMKNLLPAGLTLKLQPYMLPGRRHAHSYPQA